MIDHSLTECQRFVLAAMLERDIGCNWAGHLLANRGLLKRSGSHCSNLCLAGSSVLRSLEKMGLAVRYQRQTGDWTNTAYYLTDAGRRAVKVKP